MTTPMMKQFHAAKKEHPDGLLFFRMGDFFELFGEDAVEASELLGLTLTSREKGDGALPMAGVPVRSIDGYFNRLIRLGRKVVVCDQIQDPSEAKGIVERAITRVITPGTVMEEDGLEDAEHNFLCGVFLSGSVAGLAWADVSTGTFLVDEVPAEQALAAVLQIDPAECLMPESALDAESSYGSLRQGLDRPCSTLPDWRFDPDSCRSLLEEHFRVKRLDGFGVTDAPAALRAAGAVLHYFRETQRAALGHITSLRRVQRQDQMILDRTTTASLELVKTLRGGDRKGSLVWVLDKTLTPMGARLLRTWVLEPLQDVDQIRGRQDVVAELVADSELQDDLRAALKPVQDVDRLLARIACGRATARELVALRTSLSRVPEIRAALSRGVSAELQKAWSEMPDVEPLHDLLQRALRDEVPLTVKEGGLIREGFDPDLDVLLSLGSEGKNWMADFQAREQQRTGLPSLKVGYNRVFGYYIEISQSQAVRAPDEYIRKQTLKNAERYITPELKEYEERVLGAEEKIKQREYEHFLVLRDAVREALPELQVLSRVLALVDTFQSLAHVAARGRWVRPTVDESRDIEIKEGRHPVLDELLDDTPFVPNDLLFLAGSREFLLITGPNMAGKSTYIRQVALLVILAQMGSFVPADSARIGVVDRVFTRVGANDELQRGNSTFMVEMIETAEILNNASNRSLVILDEVGRGTSTYDGLAIAWAMTEHLASKIRSRTLFATHYHQLLGLVDSLSNAENLAVAVREWGEEIVFLHKIVEGGTDRSYGIHVARLAGLPPAILVRAREVLEEIEEASGKKALSPASGEQQLSLFADQDDRLRRAILEADLDGLSPRQALQMIYELRTLAES